MKFEETLREATFNTLCAANLYYRIRRGFVWTFAAAAIALIVVTGWSFWFFLIPAFALFDGLCAQQCIFQIRGELARRERETTAPYSPR
jgi:fatty acid desaturase